MRKGQSSPKTCRQRLPQSGGHFAELPRLTASPFCRLQVHLPLPLPCARLLGLLRAPRPGLGLCTRAGHERGERGVGGGRAGGEGSRGSAEVCGVNPDAVRNEHPSDRFPGIKDASFAGGFVRRRRALAGYTRTSQPASGPKGSGGAHAHTPRPAGSRDLRGGAEWRCFCDEVIPRAVASCPRPSTSPPTAPRHQS